MWPFGVVLFQFDMLCFCFPCQDLIEKALEDLVFAGKLLERPEEANRFFLCPLSRCNVKRENRQVLGLELDKANHALYVAFSSCVVRVPLSRCAAFNTCRRLVWLVLVGLFFPLNNYVHMVTKKRP